MQICSVRGGWTNLFVQLSDDIVLVMQYFHHPQILFLSFPRLSLHHNGHYCSQVFVIYLYL